MGNLFNLDSPIMRFLTKVADLMWLNILAIICCIPIVTIGPTMTAVHYVALKMYRNEEGYITRDFFKSFKTNFKQALIIWLMMLLFFIVMLGDVYIIFFSTLEFPKMLNAVLMAIGVLVLVVTTYIFPVLSRYNNSIKNTIKNGCIMSILAFPKSILMIIVGCVPIAILLLSIQWVPVVFLLGISGPAYFSAMLYSGTFKKFEPEEETTEEEEYHVPEENFGEDEKQINTEVEGE